jgi:hypothetical protein
MPLTPNYGWFYPASTERPGLMWWFLERLAVAADAQVAAIDAASSGAVAGLPKGILARGRRGADNTGITTEEGVLRLDDIPILAGRLYRIVGKGSVNAVTTRVIANLRYTTDGSTPTTGSTLLEEHVFNAVAVTSTGGSWRVEGYYVPGSNQTLSVLLSVSAGSAVTVFGTNEERCELFIEDCGADPGDTGADV